MSHRPTVAYFCMEYGLRTDMKTYSGGLGILAGDYLKGASDRGDPVIGLGIRWKYGYVSQTVAADGTVTDSFPQWDAGALEDTGIRVTVTVAGREIEVMAWKVKPEVGVKDLYLLDTDLPGNEGTLITDGLYRGDGKHRIAQEIVLGVGGVRVLRALGITPDVVHFNEGHAVLAGIELIREARENNRLSFGDALKLVREHIVFTTHTPVPAGNEQHKIADLMAQGANLGLDRGQMKRLGGSPFNMTVAALNLSRDANAVSELHGETARKMWSDVKRATPIIGITNGVHRPSWVDDGIIRARADGAALWARHMELKRALIDQVRTRAGVTLKDDVLLIGFARRAVAYKRADLLGRAGPEVEALLRDGRFQVVFAGKAHPADQDGKDMLRRIKDFAAKFPAQVAYVENYDMDLGAALTRGCDVWLNTPRRPQEACGTSGMKAAMNGVLNLSVLDGWWPEACRTGQNGWAIGGPNAPRDIAEQDRQDAAHLARQLTGDVVPTYYGDRDRWIAMMQASIADTHDRFSVETMLDTYYARLYQG